MKCKKCGKEISEDASFCIHCGEKNEVTSALVEKPANGSLKKIIIAAIIIIMAGLVGIFAYLGNNSLKKNSDKNGKASNVLENESEDFDDQAAPETPVPTETAVPTATNTPTPTSTSTPASESKTEVTTEPVVTTQAPVTTTKPVETTSEPTTQEPVIKSKTVDRIGSLTHYNWEKDPINSSNCFNTTDVNNIFYMSGNDAWVFWRFADKGIVGCGKDYLNAYNTYDKITNTENVAYAETYVGFTASIKNKTLSVNNYYNLNGVNCSNIEITYMNGTTPRYTVTSDNNISADLSDESYVNGYYVITAEYASAAHTYIANMYLYINYASNKDSDFEAYVCYGRHLYSFETEGPTTRQAKITEMIEAKGITPENSLNYNIAYPYEAKGQAEYNGYSTYVSDTEYWINKSDEILAGHENDSAAYKALLLHDWMTENLVYDWYKANRLNNPRYYGYYHTGDFYVSQCNVGVCRDFVNIYAIMCRKHGIPCIILGNTAEGHVWNAVYLYDQWLEVDITGDINREARNADVTDVTAATQENTHSFKHFCSYAYSDLMPIASEINSWLHYQ